MKRMLLVLAFLCSAARLASAQSIAGEWEGLLKGPARDLHVALHVAQTDAGGFTATIDSTDQRALGVPVTSIALTGSKLTFTVNAFQGSFEGTVNANVTEIDGTWTQGLRTSLVFKRATARAPAAPAAPAPAPPSDIDGVWMGTLTFGVTPLRVVVHVTNTAGGLTATMDSPDQGAKGIPVAAVTRNGASLKLDVRVNGGVFDGKIDDAHTTIDGTWSQGGVVVPLVLKPVKDVASIEIRRPQNPLKPYPYREEEVAYENPSALVTLAGTAHVTLAGTLTLPPGSGPFPAVVLITGSGPQDRDESVAGHRPFLVLADYLTRRGIAVLRADDRGFGKSTGNFSAATTADFATDTEAGVAYLRTRREIDPRRIGLVGHSEGAIIAPMVAARDPKIAFIVMMAGSGVRGDEVLAEQNVLVAEAVGATHDQALARGALIRKLSALVEQEPDDDKLEAKAREAFAGETTPGETRAQIKALSTPWFRYFLSYDPAPALRHVACPVLALNGEKDLQVPPKQNLPAIRAALQAGGNKNIDLEELPGLNHLFQTAKTGSPTEYPQIEETIAPIALDTIARWIEKVSAPK